MTESKKLIFYKCHRIHSYIFRDMSGTQQLNDRSMLQVPQRALTPPIRPRVKTPGDASCFDDYPETDWRSQPPLPPDQLALFQDF